MKGIGPGLTGGGVLRRFRHESLGSRFFLWVRWVWTPYREVARALPEKGRILDAGCGHGLLALEMALRSPARRVLGTDHDAPRVEAARKAAQDVPNLEFKSADFSRIPKGPFDGMVYMDDLHYLTYEAQEKLFRESRKALRSGGALVFREVARSGSFFSRWNLIHEWIMTRLGFTKAGRLHFRTPEGWRKAAQDAGFRVRMRPLSRPPFADILFECVKR